MKRKFKFTGKHQSRRGIISFCLGLLSGLMTAALLAAAYQTKGQGGRWIALAGFLAVLSAVAGMIYGVVSTYEEDVYRLFPWAGVVMNGVVLTAYATIYVLGW